MKRVSPFDQPEARPLAADLDKLGGGKFRSREPVTPTSKSAVSQRATHRPVPPPARDCAVTFRTFQSTRDEFYAIAVGQNWKAGETFERAVAALREQLRNGFTDIAKT